MSDMSLSNIFADIVPWARQAKEPIDKWDINLKNVVQSKRNHQQNVKGEHICQ